jgi:hypothetical protein
MDNGSPRHSVRPQFAPVLLEARADEAQLYVVSAAVRVGDEQPLHRHRVRPRDDRAPLHRRVPGLP